MKLVQGLYESLINQLVDAGIEEAAAHDLRAEVRSLDPGDSHTYLTQYLADHIRRALSSIPKEERLEKQLKLVNRILSLLSENTPEAILLDESEL